MQKAQIGIIGGSGLYEIDGIQDCQWVKVDTPFGDPSDEYLIGSLDGIGVAFLPRHGRGHPITPTELNYRANIWGMKSLGVERIISVSAVGSYRLELKPKDVVLVDQFVDRTNQARKTTFFSDGIVGHVSFADPVCGSLKETLFECAKEAGAAVHPKGTYLNMEGPAFSTRAESHLFRSWGMDVIGMTNMPEARLAREAEICYSTMAMVTDYDCWHEEDVDIKTVIENLLANVDTAKKIIKLAVPELTKARRDCCCVNALQNAIITKPELIPAETKKKLALIVGKYIT